ncbi:MULTISPECIES: TraX family protein [unclassified Adlercreutzia]|uniref:TraX family protein n=1 Tax=unclassified Adlercreutzia TaxID=2636013 RepID=UPI0013ECCA98|nr:MULTISPECIES: TraX family protein [unclassified Adlercreutzia]
MSPRPTTGLRPDVSAFTLKVAAIIGMTCNHVANVFSGAFAGYDLWGAPALLILYALGGMTFPVMAFLVSEGYARTSNMRRYAKRLLAFALISQVPFSLLWGLEGNVMFTLLAGLGILYARDHCKSPGAFAACFCLALGISAFCDWPVIGPLMIFLFHELRSQGARGIMLTMLVPFASTGIPALANILTGGALPSYSLAGTTALFTSWCELGYACVGILFAATFITRYQGRRGRPLKWFFYAYYPAHLLVIAAAAHLIL